MKITPALTRHCSEKLLHAALTNQGDVLGYEAFDGPREDANDDEDGDQVCEADMVNFLDELATDALGGGQPNVLARLLQTRAERRMDPVTAALLEHMGVVSAAALVLRDKLLSLDVAFAMVDADGDDRLTIVSGYTTGWHMTLDAARDICWDSRGNISVPAIPETLGIAATGRPLREVFSHPALDGLDLVIEEVVTDDGATTLALAGFDEDGAMDTLDVHALEDRRRAVLKMAA